MLLTNIPPKVDMPFTVWTVDISNPAADFTTIQAAINAASSGDVILVGPGTYTEQLTLKDGVRVIGISPSTEYTARTRVSYSFTGSGSVITGPSSGTGYIENLYVSVNHAAAYATRALSTTSGKVFAKNCVFSGQSIGGVSGSIYCVYASGASSGVTLVDCNIAISNEGSMSVDAVGVEIGATTVELIGCRVYSSGSYIVIDVRTNNAAAYLTIAGGTQIYGLLDKVSASSILDYGDNYIGSTSGIADDSTETIYSHYVHGLAKTNGTNDLYKLALRSLSADPGSPADGNMWYNSTTKKFRIRLNAIIKSLGQPPFNGYVITCDPTDPTADYATFAAACAAATSGSIILLGPGVYACENVTIPSGVTVQGMGRFGTGPSILYGSLSAAGFIIGVSAGTVVIRDVLVRCYTTATSGNVRAASVTGGALYAENCRFYVFDNGSGGANGYAILQNGGNVYLHQCSCEVTDTVTFVLRAGLRIDGADSVEAWDTYFESITDSVRFEHASAIGTFVSCSLPNIVRVTSASAIYLDVATRTGQIIDTGSKVLIRGPALNNYVEKTAPISADRLLITDSADSYKYRSVQMGNLVAHKVRETGGPIDLTMSTVADGQFLKRSGANIIGSTPSGSGDVVGPASSTDGAVALFDGTSGKLLKNGFVSHVRLEMGVSSPGVAITTGAKGRKYCSISGTIIGWRLVADQSTTTTVDIWKTNAAIPTNANSITASAKPALSAAELNASTTLTGWTTSVAAGDVFILEVEANNTAQYLCLELWIKES